MPDNNTVDLHTGQTVAEKSLRDEIVGLKAQNAALVQRLQLAHGAMHSEQHAHEQTRAELTRLKRSIARSAKTD